MKNLFRLIGLIAAITFPSGVWAQSGVFAGGQGFVILSAASNNSQLIGIPGPHQLLEITVLTTGAATAADLRFYDVSGAPTCSSATGVVKNYPINAASATYAGFTVQLGPLGQRFQNGIGVCITGGTANNDNTNASVGIFVNLNVK